jgi:hypothetical protein
MVLNDEFPCLTQAAFRSLPEIDDDPYRPLHKLAG